MPVKYIPYLPQTVEGQAILNNFQRTRRVLEYRDADRAIQRTQRGMPLYEVETVERIGQPDASSPNLVIRGECVSACAYLKEQGIEVDLVYIDPPFASGADYAKQVYLRRNPLAAQAIAEAEEQLELGELRSFEEKMYGDIWNKEDYLNWMYENLMAIKTIMSPTASIYLHIDWHIGPYCKVLMDEIFGEANFQAEIVWKRTTAHSDAETYGVTHDTIYFFTKNNDFLFNTVFQPYTEEYLARFKRFDVLPDGSKRFWSDGNLTAKGLRGGGYDYTYKGVRSLWRCPVETMQDLDAKGRLLFTTKGGLRSKVYLDELKGMPAQGLWDDIKPVNSQATERVDYSTQKPESLLERILNASSNAGMVVADFFGGSGVTAAVAAKLGRRFIHADINVNSIQTARDRLSAAGSGGSAIRFTVLDVKDGVSLYRNPVQTMDKLPGLILGLRKEAALDSFWAGALQDSKAGMVPVYLPNLLDHSTKVLDLPLVNQIVYQAMPNLPDGIRRVVIYFVDIDDEKQVRTYIDEAPTDIQVELRDLKQVLDEVVLNDELDHTLTENDGFWTLTVERFRSDRLMQKISDYNLKRGVQSVNGQLTLGEGEGSTDEPETVATAKKGKVAKFKPITISDEGLELIEYLSLDCTTDNGSWQSDMELKIDKRGYVLLNGKKTGQFWDATIRSEAKPLRLKVRNIAGDESVMGV